MRDTDFGKSLLSALGDAVGTIEGNWQGAAAARTFVALATRLLSLSTCNVVRKGCSRFLRRVRAISLRWTRELARKLQEGWKEEELKNLNARMLEMALTCHETFDIDPHHLPDLLKSDEDIAVVTECSVIVHDRCPVLTGDLPASVKTLLQRYWRLSYVLEPLLRKRILEIRSGLDSTVGRLWAGYVPGSPWTALTGYSSSYDVRLDERSRPAMFSKLQGRSRKKITWHTLRDNDFSCTSLRSPKISSKFDQSAKPAHWINVGSSTSRPPSRFHAIPLKRPAFPCVGNGAVGIFRGLMEQFSIRE